MRTFSKGYYSKAHANHWKARRAHERAIKCYMNAKNKFTGILEIIRSVWFVILMVCVCLFIFTKESHFNLCFVTPKYLTSIIIAYVMDVGSLTYVFDYFVWQILVLIVTAGGAVQLNNTWHTIFLTVASKHS